MSCLAGVLGTGRGPGGGGGGLALPGRDRLAVVGMSIHEPTLNELGLISHFVVT